jgi:hypothetical protein
MSRTTQYLRGKTRERGTKTERFMTDGFDRWAESETPASFNSMEKLPTELTKGTMATGMRYGQPLDGMVGSARKRKGKKGGAWYDEVWNKISNEFVNPQSYLQQGVGQVTNEFTNPDSYLAQGVGKVGNEFTDKDSLLRAQYLGQAADGVAKAAPILDMLGEQMGLGKGVGKTMAEVLKGAQEVNKAAKSVGLGKKRGGRVYTSPYGRPYDRPVKGGKKGALDYVSEFVPESRDSISQAKSYAPLLKMLLKGQAPQYSSQIDEGAKFLGLGKKKGKKGGFIDFGAVGRAFENTFDPNKNGLAQAFQPIPIQQAVKHSQAEVKNKEGGRKPSARNEIVKRVMAERGCSLPQASSIVKREGLY